MPAERGPGSRTRGHAREDKPANSPCVFICREDAPGPWTPCRLPEPSAWAALCPVTVGCDKRSLKDLNTQTPSINKAAGVPEKEAIWGSPRRLLLHINTRPHTLPPSTLTFQILFAQRGMLDEGQGQRCTFHLEFGLPLAGGEESPRLLGTQGGPGGSGAKPRPLLPDPLLRGVSRGEWGLFHIWAREQQSPDRQQSACKPFMSSVTTRHSCRPVRKPQVETPATAEEALRTRDPAGGASENTTQQGFTKCHHRRITKGGDGWAERARGSQERKEAAGSPELSRGISPPGVEGLCVWP